MSQNRPDGVDAQGSQQRAEHIHVYEKKGIFERITRGARSKVFAAIMAFLAGGGKEISAQERQYSNGPSVMESRHDPVRQKQRRNRARVDAIMHEDGAASSSQAHGVEERGNATYIQRPGTPAQNSRRNNPHVFIQRHPSDAHRRSTVPQVVPASPFPLQSDRHARTRRTAPIPAQNHVRISREAPHINPSVAPSIAHLDHPLMSPKAAEFVHLITNGFGNGDADKRRIEKELIAILSGRDMQGNPDPQNSLGRDFANQIVHQKNNPAYLLMALDKDPSAIPGILRKAKTLGQELGIPLEPFDISTLDHVFSLAALAHEPYAADIIRTLRSSRINRGFSWGQRKSFQLEEDRSTIAIVSRNIAARGYGALRDRRTKDTMILEEWRALRHRQEEAFSSGPDVLQSRNGTVERLKPIDVLVIYDPTLGSDKDFATDMAGRMAGLVRCMNADASQKDSVHPARFFKINTMDRASLEDVLGKARAIESYSRMAGHHLVTFFVLHGHTTKGLGMLFKDTPAKKRVGKNFDQLASGFDHDQTSIFLSSCFSGAHADLLKNRKDLKNVHFNVQNTVNSLDTGSEESYFIPWAYQINPETNRPNADINGDGKVTLNELKYFMDTQELLNDPSSFDQEGRQFTGMGNPAMVENIA